MRAGSREGEGEGRAGGGAAALAALAQAPSLSRRERLPSRRAAATRARRRRLVAHPRTCRKVESTPAADACKDPCVACGRRARRAPGVLAPVASDNHARALQWFACAPHNRPGPGVRVAGRHAREEEELETHRCTCKKKKKRNPTTSGSIALVQVVPKRERHLVVAAAVHSSPAARTRGPRRTGSPPSTMRETPPVRPRR